LAKDLFPPRQKLEAVNFKPFLVLAVAAGCAAGLAANTPAALPAAAATPPPTPPAIETPATPAAAPADTPFPLPSGFALPASSAAPSAHPSGSPTPPPDNRKGIEGVWEVQIQRYDKTEYTHFTLVQTGSTLAGTYRDSGGHKFPLAGSVDGDSVRLIVSMPDGTSLLLEGRLDGTTDMIGMLTTPKEQVPFTAGYRPKEKWIENVNPAPGGLGIPAGGAPAGGAPGGPSGGYPPANRFST
jgi:hypothetical protein